MADDRTRPPSVVLRGAFWFTGLIVAAAIAPPVTAGEGSLWHDLRRAVGVPVAVGLIALGLVAASLVAAAVYGWLQVPGRKVLDRVAYVTRMLPYWLRRLARGGDPGSGQSNQRYATEQDFFNDRKPQGLQRDYGVRWRDRGSDWTYRVTWIGDTGELIAVANTGDEEVELLAVIPDEDEVNRRLADWGYVGESFAVTSLAWVRRRAIGWRVPLPPRARWLKREAHAPMRPWPVPPPPSPKRAEGAYHGSRGENERRVEVHDADGVRALHHHVWISPTGFAWGYSGSGPTDLARSVLADRLGYVPQSRVYFAFREDIVAHLPRDFVLTFDEVDRWIDEHGSLFADNPRAEPFDPYAGGGR